MARRIAAVATLVAAIASGAAAPVVAQSSLARVLIWEEGLRGTDEEELRWPVAVASASAREIVVADAFGSRLLLFRDDGLAWQLERTVLLGAAPVGLVWDGRRYVAALRDGHGLVVFEPPQMLQRRISLPREVVVGAIAARPDGALLLYDLARGRVVELTANGDVARETVIDDRVTALAAAPAGGFYVAIAQDGTLVKYDTSGAREAVWELPGEGPTPAWPVALVVEPGGDVAVVDRHGGRIVVLDVGGKPVGVGSRRGWEPGLLRFPSAITRLADGRLLVADQGNARVQIFRRSDRTP